ncbi:MAG: D-alanyl-D-alanine carboxypeptidase, partial [Gammaproteobacteria bacterium]
LLAALPGARADALPAPIAAALAEYRIPASKISLVVRAMGGGDGAPLLRHNAGTPRNPASVIKLLTTLAALEVLGPDYRWETAYLADGKLGGGTLRGDLILRGGGDPFITVENFLGHLLALRQAGLRRIKGDLVIDNTKFAAARHDRAAFDDKPTRSYNIGPDAALINLSATRFVLQPRDGRIEVRAEPPLAGLRIESRIAARAGKCITPERGWGYRIARTDATRRESRRQSGAHAAVRARIPLSPLRIRFHGDYRAECGAHEITRSIVPNAEYTCRLFTALWRKMGGKIGGCRRDITPPHARALLTRESAPLADIITGINKFSNNVMSRQLLLTLGAEHAEAGRQSGDGEQNEGGGQDGGGENAAAEQTGISAQQSGGDVENSDAEFGTAGQNRGGEENVAVEQSDNSAQTGTGEENDDAEFGTAGQTGDGEQNVAVVHPGNSAQTDDGEENSDAESGIAGQNRAGEQNVAVEQSDNSAQPGTGEENDNAESDTAEQTNTAEQTDAPSAIDAAPATPEAGIAAIHDWLATAALDMPALVIDNGAGLSRDSRASAAGLSRLLAHAWRSRYRPEFLSSLSLIATDGTMRKRLPDSELQGRARIKTGLIDYVRSMAGYVYARDGRHYAVAMIIDSRRVNFWSGNAVQDAVLEWVFAR